MLFLGLVFSLGLWVFGVLGLALIIGLGVRKWKMKLK